MTLRPKELLFQVSLFWLFFSSTDLVSFVVSNCRRPIVISLIEQQKQTDYDYSTRQIVTLMRLLNTSCLLLEARKKLEIFFSCFFTLFSVVCSCGYSFIQCIIVNEIISYIFYYFNSQEKTNDVELILQLRILWGACFQIRLAAIVSDGSGDMLFKHSLYSYFKKTRQFSDCIKVLHAFI